MAFVLFKGIDWNRRIVITDEDTGLPSDLTGIQVAVTLKRRSSDAALVILAVGSGVTLCTQSGATLGMADVTIVGGLTATLDAANHVITVLVDGQVAIAPTKLAVRDV